MTEKPNSPSLRSTRDCIGSAVSWLLELFYRTIHAIDRDLDVQSVRIRACPETSCAPGEVFGS